MVDTDWSFSLRSTGRLCEAPDSDDEDEGSLGDAEAVSHLSSSSSILHQIDLAPREDNAIYKPNPWSIARVNAATRSRQSYVTVNSVPKEPVARKPPQGVIVDAFKRQAQKPTKSSAQANLSQTPSQTSASTCITRALGAPPVVPARSSTPTAHITTSCVNLVSMPSQPATMEQRQSRSLPPFLPRKASLASRPSKSTHRPPNPNFAPNLKRVLPFSSPGPLPHPKRSNPSTSRPFMAPGRTPAQFLPHILEPQAAAASSGHLTPTISAYQEDRNLAHPLRPFRHPALVKLERKTASPHLGQNTRLSPYPQSNWPVTKASAEPEKTPSSPSFSQARHFFEHGPPPVTPAKHSSPDSAPLKEELRPIPSPPRPRIRSPPRKRTNAYDQLSPSPDSEWSTLKSSTRKANNKTKPKVSDAKGGKFRLPLSLGIVTPKEPPPQKKVRVVTYLPPPPPKKQKILTGPHPRTRTSGLLSPPPSDETAPPSSPSPSVRFDSNDVSARYKIVRAKIRQVRIPDEHPRVLVMQFDPFLRDFLLLFTPVAESA